LFRQGRAAREGGLFRDGAWARFTEAILIWLLRPAGAAWRRDEEEKMKRISMAGLAFAALAGCSQERSAPAAPAEAQTAAPALAPEGAPVGAVTKFRAPLEQGEGLEIIVQDVRFAAGQTLPLHYHPGEEYIYLIEGEVVHIEEGAEDRLVRAGEALRIPVGKVHAARTRDMPARAVIFRVHREGQPERVVIE